MNGLPRASGLHHVAGEDVERKLELLPELVLPLLDKASGRDDQATVDIATNNELVNVEAGHDGLARARIIGEEVAQRLPREELLVNGFDLMRQRVDGRRLNGDVGVKEVPELNAARL